MMDIFDMGKYDFYVWTSMAVFLLAILADFISLKNKQKHLKRLIKAKGIKAKNRKTQNKNDNNWSNET